jgi:hypothetical protein
MYQSKMPRWPLPLGPALKPMPGGAQDAMRGAFGILPSPLPPFLAEQPSIQSEAASAAPVSDPPQSRDASPVDREGFVTHYFRWHVSVPLPTLKRHADGTYSLWDAGYEKRLDDKDNEIAALKSALKSAASPKPEPSSHAPLHRAIARSAR